MVRKKKEEIKIDEIKAPIPPVSPLFSNMVIVLSHPDMVLLDFGFIGPSYRKPYGLEDNHISRICLDWDAAENLVEQLNNAFSEYKKKLPSKRNNKKGDK